MPVPPLQIRLASDRELGYQASTFRHTPRATWNAAVAQLVEHVIRNDGVVGSSPISGTSKFDLIISHIKLVKLSAQPETDRDGFDACGIG